MDDPALVLSHFTKHRGVRLHRPPAHDPSVLSFVVGDSCTACDPAPSLPSSLDALSGPFWNLTSMNAVIAADRHESLV